MEDLNEQNTEAAASQSAPDQLDAAGRSLAEALRISFNILKFVMVVLVVLFLASGFFIVGPDEQAIVLRFGKICGIGDQRILKPGLHWSLPYPVDEIIRIPIKKVQTLAIEDFWYYQTEKEKLAEAAGSPAPQRVGQTLNLVRGDGYCITRNETIVGLAGNDYNIVHCRWKLTYRIDDPELFFRNIYVDQPQAGQSFADVIIQSTDIQALLKSLAADAVVTTLAEFSIDEAILSKADIAQSVKGLLQDRLHRVKSGIKVVAMELTSITWPRQVDAAFQESIQASQKSQKLISESRGYRQKVLNEADGTAQKKIAESRAYKTKVVESAKADAEYLKKLLPEYRRYPELVIQKIYQDAIESVLDNVDEKIILEPAASNQPREVRIQLNRDPGIKSK